MSCVCFRGNFDDYKSFNAEKSEKYLQTSKLITYIKKPYQQDFET